MNTFVARGTDYWQGGLELDPLRLNKQLVEVQQIHMALTSGGPLHILHHPATQMWLGQEQALLWYGHVTYAAYQARFDRKHKSGEYIERHRQAGDFPFPDWVNILAAYHRAKLWHKDKQYYASYNEQNMAEPGANYPVTKDGRTCAWVRSDGKTWYLLGKAPSFKTAWAAVQYVRSITP